MDLTGKVSVVLNEEPAGQKTRQHFLLDVEDGNYTNQYAFEIYDRKANAPKVGDRVKVTFFIGTGRAHDKFGDGSNVKIYSNPHKVTKIEAA